MQHFFLAPLLSVCPETTSLIGYVSCLNNQLQHYTTLFTAPLSCHCLHKKVLRHYVTLLCEINVSCSGSEPDSFSFFTLQSWNVFFLHFCLFLQVYPFPNHHNDDKRDVFQLDTRHCPIVMERHRWLKREHRSWMPWHTGRGQSKMEKKKMCPRLLDYLVVVGARWELNLWCSFSLMKCPSPYSHKGWYKYCFENLCKSWQSISLPSDQLSWQKLQKNHSFW